MLQLTTYRLSPHVSAFSTTRQGGVSKDNYASLNINPYCGDAPTAVEQNRRLLCQELSLDENRLVLPHQTHGTTIRQIGEEFFSLSPSVRQMVLDGVDALITDLPEVCIGVSTADCIPILLYDSIHRSMAAVHAGWRGTAKRILQKTVEEMGRAYQTRPETLRAVIGPGISLTHFEVGNEVYQAFAQAGFAMEPDDKKNGTSTCLFATNCNCKSWVLSRQTFKTRPSAPMPTITNISLPEGLERPPGEFLRA